MISTSLLLLLLAAVHCGLCVELILTGSTVLTPGQSLTLTCKVSGYSVTSTYCTVWIRQPAGKTLEWIGHICPGGDTYYIDKLKSRFQITRDTSSNTVTLTGQNMQTEDTAVYYCARMTHSDTHQQHPCTKNTSYSEAQEAQCLILNTNVYGEELTQPASMTVQPGQSLSINCKVSYSVTNYAIAWIRQPAGKALEWIGLINNGGSLFYNDKLKNKFSISRDTSSNTVTLTGQNMQTEDTAVYYCAREPHSDTHHQHPVQKLPILCT
ncbi:hypothetical protein C0J50_13171 [Silurus asotus]|uniref:Ig-like domain-containing protein n=1 Tax=Silurus asotus TaxID=30991 RepID=A0AAD5B3K7_SILAS|nr:hypothetical protein C0J50_13171 [Silurus asotus]